MTRDAANSHKTAIGRTKPSAPARLLVSRGLVSQSGPVLDYGCGRGFDATYYGWDRFDPFYYPDVFYFEGAYQTVLCSYVLNTLGRGKEKGVLVRIRSLLAPNGVAYITVRRNLKKDGFTSKGTYQRIVRLNLPIVEENSDYCIYRMDKSSAKDFS